MMELLVEDLEVVERVAEQLGLQLNLLKSEVIYKESSTLDEFITVCPNVHVTSPEHATLLGSSIGVSTDERILEKITT